VKAYSASRFLTVDPEDYFVFTESRPVVSLGEDGIRKLEWPKNEAHWAHLPDSQHDLVVVTGTEPNLRWKTFSDRMGAALADLSPGIVCTLVARPAATPHTRPIPISGSSADPRIAARYGLGRSLYQGPTGILGVLHDVLRHRGISLMSLSAGVPHYLNVEENPSATMALLRALEPVIGLPAPIGDLEAEGQRFLQRVDEASSGDEQIRSYVRTLEEHYGEHHDEDPSEGGEGAELPSADDILRDVEDFLRGTN
jgi:hypothetical protein